MGSSRFALRPCLELLCTNMLSEMARRGPSTVICVAMTTCKWEAREESFGCRQDGASAAILRFKVAAANASQDRLLPRDARRLPRDPAPRDTHAFPWEPRDDDGERPVGGVRYGRLKYGHRPPRNTAPPPPDLANNPFGPSNRSETNGSVNLIFNADETSIWMGTWRGSFQVPQKLDIKAAAERNEGAFADEIRK